ncbi:FG-GAP repeat domain-containing protein [Streptomyces sp. NPDC059593]|uniref:FG-GAP repeat domain-containing protein n=1 Tax=Streptomyces sp. NPDC059593 TaxID=3346878 RepID=UPI00367B436D
MSYHRAASHLRTSRHTSRRLLAVAVGAVLAVTAAVPAASAAPATSAVVASVAGETGTQAVVPFPRGARLLGAGRTGFLTLGSYDVSGQSWTRYADGSVTRFGDMEWVSPSYASDAVVIAGPGSVSLMDMATGTSLVSADLDNSTTTFAGAVGSTLLVQNGSGISLRRTVGGVVSARPVTGLPAVSEAFAVAGTSRHALVKYQSLSGGKLVWNWALIDLTTAAVTEKRQIAVPADWDGEMALSGTHVAWVEAGTGGAAVVVAKRGGGATQRFPITSHWNVSVGLVGDWVTYAQRDGFTGTYKDPLFAVTARSLTTPTTTRRLVDHLTSSAVAPDGALLVRGGTVAGGEGLYRIAPGATAAATPVVTRVASTGEPTKVTLLGHNIPAVVDLDKVKSLAMAWRLSRTNVEATIRIRNTRTGEARTESVRPLRVPDYTHARFTWRGELNWNGESDLWTGASAGPYTWEIVARPLNGIGPDMRASGSFTVARKPGAHDYDGDGSPDVLQRDAGGRLWIADAFRAPGATTLGQNPGLLVGTGWQVYDRIEAVGNVGGSAFGDLVARDRAGVLWLYQGTGNAKAPFATRVRVGSGWNAYRQLTGGSDLTGDGRADLVATDAAGALWLYKGTGSASAPFTAGKRIGTGGWGGYNQLTAVGNIAGGTAGDLVARDGAGVLWLYLGKGDGTFAPRTRIGAGWSAYGQLVGIGDADRDGRPDLYASASDGSDTAYLYRGTGNWTQPFRAPENVSAYSSIADPAFNLFA